MADVFPPEQRSEIMSRIRSSGTTPEARLCASVREALGGRWRIDRNVRTLPGQPDVVVAGLHLAIFADGCFYHGCPSMAICQNPTWITGCRNCGPQPEA